MPLATAAGHQFFRIFAEAYLLTGKVILKTISIVINQKQKRAKARQKSGPGSLACGGSFFLS